MLISKRLHLLLTPKWKTEEGETKAVFGPTCLCCSERLRFSVISEGPSILEWQIEGCENSYTSAQIVVCFNWNHYRKAFRVFRRSSAHKYSQQRMISEQGRKGPVRVYKKSFNTRGYKQEVSLITDARVQQLDWVVWINVSQVIYLNSFFVHLFTPFLPIAERSTYISGLKLYIPWAANLQAGPGDLPELQSIFC